MTETTNYQPILDMERDTIYVNASLETLTPKLVLQKAGVKITDYRTKSDLTSQAIVDLGNYQTTQAYDGKSQSVAIKFNNGVDTLTLGMIYVINHGYATSQTNNDPKNKTTMTSTKQNQPYDWLQWLLLILVIILLSLVMKVYHQETKLYNLVNDQIQTQKTQKQKQVNQANQQNLQKVNQLSQQVKQLEQGYKKGGKKEDYQNGLNGIRNQLKQVPQSSKQVKTAVNNLNNLINQVFNADPKKLKV